VIDTLPPPVVNSPDIAPPVVNAIAPPVIDVPSFDPPRYNPPTLNSDPVLTGPQLPGYKPPTPPIPDPTRELGPSKPQSPAPSTRPEIDLPIVGNVPLPYGREVALAGTTAIGATAAALLGKSIVEWMVKKMRPTVKKITLKTKEKLGKQFTDYEVQQFFLFEGRTPHVRSVAKRLEKEKKAEKERQLEVHLQRRHQRKR
jgi:hypothetical protein